MKVQALNDGYYCEQRIRKGQVFELKPREIVRKDEKENPLQAVHVTAEQQFSEKWMRKVEPGQDPLPTDEPRPLILPGVKVKQETKKRTLSDLEDSVI